MKGFRKFTEDIAAPTNSVGGGAIAGLGVGPQGEPGVPGKLFRRKRKTELKQLVPNDMNEDAFTGTFMGHKVFELESDAFHNARLGKKKYSRWSKATGGNEEVSSYGRKTRKPIIVADKRTGVMYFLRHPKK
jgi:hypothetical protein